MDEAEYQQFKKKLYRFISENPSRNGASALQKINAEFPHIKRDYRNRALRELKG